MRNTLRYSATVALLGVAFGMMPPQAVALDGPLTATAQKLMQNFSSAEETLEYHFMLKMPAFADDNRDQVFAKMADALKPMVQLGPLKGLKTGSYIDSKDRTLDKAHLILRLRPGQLTVKARSSSLNDLMDLQACIGQKIKYEKDFFEEPGFSISSEYSFKKEEWLADPTKATVRQTMDFMQEKCPALLQQLEPYLKPMEAMTAPGTARMYSADIKLDHPIQDSLKESGFTMWMFPGSSHTLGEIAWTGRVKDKPSLEQLYKDVREKLIKADLLASDQSSKTEQYFFAYFGARTPAK
jgi:hypothetical protein